MKILYISFSDLDFSINNVYIEGIRQYGAEVVGFALKEGRIKKYQEILCFYRKNYQRADFIMVGYDSPEAVIWVKLLSLFSGKKVVYNALCSVYERLVISRSLVKPWSPKGIYYWLSDIIACIFADFVMLESKPQIEFFENKFFLKESKAICAYTGVDEKDFYYDAGVEKFSTFTVIFRGQLLPEAGAEYAVEAANVLKNEDIRFIIHCFGHGLPKVKSLIEKYQLKNIRLITDFLPIEEVRENMLKSHLVLGQLSDHERLDRTIPHKAYESLAMKLPYLTARNKGIMSLLEEGKTCLACNPADSKDLADKILWSKNNISKLEQISIEGHDLFLKQLQTKILAKELLKKLSLL